MATAFARTPTPDASAISNIWLQRPDGHFRIERMAGRPLGAARRESVPMATAERAIDPVRAKQRDLLLHPGFSEQALALRAAMSYAPERASEYVERGWWRDDTLAKWLARHATATPDAPAIRHGETTISWQQLARKVDTLAGALAALGIARGEVVSVQLPNEPEFLIAYLAITSLGAVMSTIHMPYRAAEIETLVGHAKSRAVICLSAAKDYPAAEVMLALKTRLPLLDHVIALGAPIEGALSLAELIAHDREMPKPEEPPVASDPFLLLFTSGTTSAPKAVPLSYHNMLSNARLGAPEHGITAADTILSAAPFSHLYGLYSFHVAMAVGACNLLLPVFTPPDLAATIERGRPTALWTAPAHVAACMGLGLFDKHDAGSLKLAIISGSACPPELAYAFAAKARNCAVTQLWGMTETQGGLYTRPDDPLDISATTAGRPSPGTEVRIVDLEDQPVPHGTEGELQVRGCLLFPGYLGNPAANATAFTADGWFRTGDLALQDAAGHVRISGRTKDVINRGGVKYNPLDVELLLDRHPKVVQSAIVPVPDPVLGEKACAFIVPKHGAEVTLRELCDYLSSLDIAKIKLPERLEIVTEMPMTPTRKIIKGRLKPSAS
jgi:cyclohexanecarboxylate-CoA ligase